jgi:membrane-associated PAP2 superfamily phosphatase
MWRRADFTVSAALLLLATAWDLSGLDLAVSRYFGGAGGFALRDNPWLVSALHDAPRVLSWLLAALLAVSLLRPRWLDTGRRERTWWLLATIAAAAVVPLLKHASATSCPWDLAEFGGLAQHVPHWQWGLADGGGGHCFPSGHATTAFVWFSGGFALARAKPVLARRWTFGVLVLGLLLGAAQVARGAHYVSHVLWAACLCHASLLLVAPGLERVRRAAGGAASMQARAAVTSQL